MTIGKENNEDTIKYITFAVANMNNTWYETTVKCLGYSCWHDAQTEANDALLESLESQNDVSFIKQIATGEWYEQNIRQN